MLWRKKFRTPIPLKLKKSRRTRYFVTLHNFSAHARVLDYAYTFSSLNAYPLNCQVQIEEASFAVVSYAGHSKKGYGKFFESLSEVSITLITGLANRNEYINNISLNSSLQRPEEESRFNTYVRNIRLFILFGS